MSAHICSDKTTNTLAQLALIADGDSRQRIADVLRAENTRSVNFCYNENEAPEPIVFKHSDEVASMTSAAIVRRCNYFDYQACETEDYKESEAARIVEGIRQEAARKAIEDLLVRQDDALRFGHRILSDEGQEALMNCSSSERVDLVFKLVPGFEAEYDAAPWGLY